VPRATYLKEEMCGSGRTELARNMKKGEKMTLVGSKFHQ